MDYTDSGTARGLQEEAEQSKAEIMTATLRTLAATSTAGNANSKKHRGEESSCQWFGSDGNRRREDKTHSGGSFLRSRLKKLQRKGIPKERPKELWAIVISKNTKKLLKRLAAMPGIKWKKACNPSGSSTSQASGAKTKGSKIRSWWTCSTKA